MTDKRIVYINEQTVGSVTSRTIIKTNTVQQLKELLNMTTNQPERKLH